MNAKNPLLYAWRRSTWIKVIVAGVVCLSIQNLHADDDKGTRILRDPDVSENKIVFAHANDLWVVDRNGGDAMRLTSDEGAESDPCFSPDGKWIAFTGQYGGNTDVFVVNADGGRPKRLTWHPGSDTVQSWTPDGRVMFRSGRLGQPTKQTRFFTVSTDGGMPEPLALPQAYQGEMSGDGEYIAYEEIRPWDREWRNYRGGQALPVQIVSTKTWDLMKAPWEGERHMDPVWMGGVCYYISERDYAANVWCFDPKSKEHRQLTHHADFDVKSIGAGAGAVVYEQAGYLHELNPKNSESKQIKINVARDMTFARPRWEDVSGGSLRQARLSPTGKRAVFQARGDLFTIPLDKGSWRNITLSSDVADRHPVWSPDGKNIAWFNDEGGEYALVIANQFGKEKRRIKIEEPSFFFIPTWSPDGKSLAFTDTDYRVLILDIESGEVKHVDTERYAHPQRSMNPVWSPDSRWIAYSRRMENHLRVIKVCDTKDGKVHQLTDGMADSISPVWDASGKYIYFLSSTNYGLNTGWLDMTSYDRPTTYSMYIALLKADEASPFLPTSDEEEVKEEKSKEESKEDSADKQEQSSSDEDKKSDTEEKEDQSSPSDKPIKKEGDKKEKKDEKKLEVVIDFEGIAQRIISADGMSSGNYLGLVEGPEGKVFVLESPDSGFGISAKRYSVKDKKADDYADSVSSMTVSHDRKKVLFQSGGSWRHADANGSGKAAKSLSTNGMRIKVDPRAEYKQMLREGWRFMRDFLYVDNVHGAPWEDVWKWYSPWLDDVNHRSDFNHVLDILSGEVAVGHSYVAGGDYPSLDRPRTGLLGVDLEIANDRLRITKIYDGGKWNRGPSGPLSHPGMKVKEGDYLLAINGRELTAADNPFEHLEATSGRTISITLNDKPEMEGSRELYVEPTGSERGLRTAEWIEERQEMVDKLSDGRLAYVWVPNTSRGGYASFNRMYFAQQDRQGAIIDERNNGGGSAADYIIEVLERELTGYFNSRAGDKRPFTQPIAGLYGPKVMIINESSGSGGDLLPYLFRFKKLGPLVGTRTWGGLVGTWDTPPLIDGGRFVAPRGGFYDVDGNWAVEGEGVAPDIEVFNDPRSVIKGGDPQLERAVAEALKALETEKFEMKPEPAPPIRSRRPDKKNEKKKKVDKGDEKEESKDADKKQ